MRALLAFLVACSSPGSRVEPAPQLRDAGTRDANAATRSGELRVAKKFSLVVFELEPKQQADERVASRFTILLREMADEYRGIDVRPTRPWLLDEEVMNGCQRQQPRCLWKIARSLRADRIVYGDVAGSDAHVRMYDVATDQPTEWTTDKLPTDEGELRAVAHDAMDALLARTP